MAARRDWTRAKLLRMNRHFGKLQTHSLVHHGKSVLTLGMPLVANNLATAGMGFTDTVMAGQLGGHALAAVAIGNTLWYTAYLAGMGVLMAVSPLVAHALGANQVQRIGHLVRQSFWIALAMGVAGLFLLHRSAPFFLAVGVDPDVVPTAVDYLSAISWGLPAILGYLCLRYMSEGLGHTRPLVYFAFTGLLVNAAGNYVFMYGKLGFPAMGAVGCGVASAITTATLFLVSLVYVRKSSRYSGVELKPLLLLPDWRTIKDILSLGVPISASALAESTFFHATALIMAVLGTAVIAAHQVALNYAATMFMIPLALHSATTVRVGHLLGRGLPADARMAGLAGIGLSALFMGVSALVMYLGRFAIAGFYTTDTAVVNMAASLLVMAAVFQLSDGVNIATLGALRGYRDARIPLYLAAFAYWGVGFPLAWYLAFRAGQGPVGVWSAIVISLTLSAVLQVWRFLAISRRETGASG
jgi:MATE family multidrug resistance protein